MAERQGGLGGIGRERIRQNLGGGHVGQEESTFERTVVGGNRQIGGPLTSPWSYPDSTRVLAYSYDYGTAVLRVRFKKYQTPWVYENVPLTLFEAFDASPSKGKFINAVLNHTSYRRAAPEEETEYP